MCTVEKVRAEKQGQAEALVPAISRARALLLLDTKAQILSDIAMPRNVVDGQS